MRLKLVYKSATTDHRLRPRPPTTDHRKKPPRPVPKKNTDFPNSKPKKTPLIPVAKYAKYTHPPGVKSLTFKKAYEIIVSGNIGHLEAYDPINLVHME